MAISLIGQEAGEYSRSLDAVRDAPVSDAGAFGGFLTAIPAGIERYTYIGSTLFSDDRPRENEEQLSERVRMAREVSRDINQRLKYTTKLDPNTYGWASQIVAQVAGVGLGAAIGTLSTGSFVGGASVAGSLIGRERTLELEEQGVDKSTATLAGLTAGVVGGLGFAAAPFYGKTLATQLTSAMGINVTAGMVDRYSTNVLVENAGYSEVAKHYRALDGEAIVADALLGAIFPSIHRLATRGEVRTDIEPTVDQVDAALVTTDQYHRDNSLPVLPRDNEELGLMQEQLNRAEEQMLIEGRPIAELDVGDLPTGARNENLLRDISEAEAILRDASKDDPEMAAFYADAMDAVRHADDFLPPKMEADVEPVTPRAEDGEAGDMTGDIFLRARAETAIQSMPAETKVVIDNQAMSAREVVAKLDEVTRVAAEDAKLANIARACALTFGE